MLCRLTAAAHESCCMLQIGAQEDVTKRLKEVFRMHGVSAMASSGFVPSDTLQIQSTCESLC